MSPHSFLWHYLWIAPQALQLILAIFMVRRKLHKQFPAFFLYISFETTFNFVLFVLDHLQSVSWYQYRWVESVGDGFSILFRFAVIYEILSSIFRAYPSLNQVGTTMFRWAVVLLIAVSLVIAFHTRGADYAPRIAAALMVLNRAVATVQCGLLFFLFLFSSYFGISRRNFVFGIATGLGIFSAVQLATAAIRTEVHVESRLLLDFLPMVTYHACVLIWFFYLFAHEPLHEPIKIPVHDLESWSRELRRLVQR